MQEAFFPKQKMSLVTFFYIFRKMKMSKKRLIWRGVNKAGMVGEKSCARSLLCENFKQQN